MTLDRSKLALIHLAVKRLGMEDAAYRSMLSRVAGVETSRDLDDDGFNAVTSEFQRLGFHSDFADANLSNRAGMASPRQVSLIRHLWREFTAGQGTDASLRHWLENHWGIGDLRFLDSSAAHRLIGALIKMKARKGSDHGAPAA